MGRVGSVNHQVGIIIKAHNGISQSKLESRQNSGLKAENGHQVSDKFHSYKSLDNARADLANLGRYAWKELGIKDMSLIGLDGVTDWINSKDITYHTASNYLSEINKVCEHLGITREQVKELRADLKENLPSKTDLARQTRAYKGLDNISLRDNAQIAFELQRDYGLRAKEAIHINISRQLEGNILSYNQKGGKLSEIKLSAELSARIRERAVNNRYEINYKTYSSELKKEIENSGQKFNGTHGIRHTFAQNRLEQGATKQEVSEAMGHTREEITNVYLR